jgi:competence protein ComEC
MLFWAFLKRLSFRALNGGAVLLLLNLFSLGYVLCFFNDSRNYQTHFQNFLADENIISAKIAAEPILKSKTISVILEVESIADSVGNFRKCSGRLQANFELDSSSIYYKYGDLILLNSKIVKISGPENPNAFNPAAYFALSDVYHQTYVRSKNTKRIGQHKGNIAYQLLIDWRKYLSSVFERHLPGSPNEKAVASALVLGVRSEFSSDLKNAYADTGATHVLSVSGLHVGLVAGLLGWLIKRIKRKKMDRFSQREIAILLAFIWFYVLLTGASASVLRSGLMFSFVILATLVRRKISVYNSLASSAFALLCLEPKFLYDIGFQLSYLALFGIVFFHPYIYKLLFFKNKFADWAWNLTAVGFAAQLATLPLGLFYFHQFPTYFWLSGLAVIPLSTVALYSGIALLVCDWIPVLGYLAGWLTYCSIAIMNACIFAIQSLPFAVISGFWLGLSEMLLLYTAIFAMAVGLIYSKRSFKFLSIATVLLFSSLQFFRIFSAANQDSIYVYKVNKSSLFEFYSGHRVYCLKDSSLAKSKIDFLVENNRIAQRAFFYKEFELRDNISLADLYINSYGVGKFRNTSFAIPSKSLLEHAENRTNPYKVDFLIICANPKLNDLEKLENLFDYRYLVFDASNSRYRINNWLRQCKERSIPFIDCSSGGKELYTFLKIEGIKSISR